MVNHADIEKKLTSLPDEIYQQEKKVLEAKEKLEMAKIKLDVEMSRAMLTAQRPNASEKKAEAITRTAETRREVLRASLEYERQEAYLNALPNQFTAIRKITSLEIELIKTNLN